MPETVADNVAVTIEYTLRDDAGNVLDSSRGRAPMVYLHGHGNLIPGLERELAGQPAGAQLQVSIDPVDAYGEHDPEKVQQVPRSAFAGIDTIETGMQFQADGPGGRTVVTVSAVEADTVTVDANHPLAGMTLHFEVQIEALRAASEEEIAHGHIHG
jgi:FKBP-type peptidyl-prolyl cis-trans isomerase SlyD